MEKRSRRRIRDLVALPAYQGLSENENGCARISILAKGANALLMAGYRSARLILSIAHLACNTSAGPYRSASALAVASYEQNVVSCSLGAWLHDVWSVV